MSYTHTVTTKNCVHSRPCVRVYNRSLDYRKDYPEIAIKISRVEKNGNYNDASTFDMFGMMSMAILGNQTIEIKVDCCLEDVAERCAKDIGDIIKEGLDENAELERKLRQQEEIYRRLEAQEKRERR